MSASSFLTFLFHYTVEHQKSCSATNLQFLEDNSFINLKLFSKQFCTCWLAEPTKKCLRCGTYQFRQDHISIHYDNRKGRGKLDGLMLLGTMSLTGLETSYCSYARPAQCFRY